MSSLATPQERLAGADEEERHGDGDEREVERLDVLEALSAWLERPLPVELGAPAKK